MIFLARGGGEGGDEGDCELQHGQDRRSLWGWRENCAGAHAAGHHQVPFKSGSWEVFNLNISFNSFQVQESHREAEVILGKRSQPQSKRGRHP